MSVAECDGTDGLSRSRGDTGSEDPSKGESVQPPPVASAGSGDGEFSLRKGSEGELDLEEEDQQQQPPGDDSATFLGQCLERQLHRPRVPYPAWDYDWDGRMTRETSFESLRTLPGLVASRRSGVVRHVLLIRHGQYVEGPENDADRVLTPLGRIQAHRAGLRLMQLARGGIPSVLFGGDDEEDASGSLRRYDGPCRIKAVHVSDMQRAKETAAIISSYLLPVCPDLRVAPPDPLLNEALPCPMIPVRPDIPGAEAEIDANRDRIEAAFRKYVHRADGDDGGARDRDSAADPASRSSGGPSAVADNVADGEVAQASEGDLLVAGGGTERDKASTPAGAGELRHEFEIIVGHGNVIRYFVCRGLQLPPEAWLRFSVFNCSITYMVISPAGYVSVRSLGDTGHLSYDETTFSGSYGYNW
jgi:serine/threonine-protein phosphatase PGAM5